MTKHVLRVYLVMGTVGVIAIVLALALGLTRTVPPGIAVVLFAAGGGLAPLLALHWRWRRRLRRLELQAEIDLRQVPVLTSRWRSGQSLRPWLLAGVAYGILLAAAVIALAVVLVHK
jgi:hypothetical protein